MRRLTPFLLVISGLVLGFLLFYNGAAGQGEPAPNAAVGDGFTYQGRLELENAPANGQYDLQFTLYDAADGGSMVGAPVTLPGETVVDGYFDVVLDFGPGVFDGEARWLQIAVRESGTGAPYTTLSPRQRLTATPYALRAGSVAWSDVQDRPAGLDDGDDDTTYTAGAGLVLDGAEFAAEGSPLANVVVVAKSGGDFTSIQAALDFIDGLGDAAADNPYLVYVAPGVYEEQVTLLAHVTLEGAGEGATIIRWTGGSQAPWQGAGSATLIGVDEATVRHLTVESDGTGQGFAVGLFNGGASPTISNVTAAAWNAGDTRGVANYNGAAPRMSEVTAIAADGTRNHALTNDASSPLMTDITARASGGEDAFGILQWGSAAPIFRDVYASASDAIDNFALFSDGGAPTITNAVLHAAGGNYAIAVYGRNGAQGLMRNVTMTASDASAINYGLYTIGSSPELTDVDITASGGSTTYGVLAENSSPTMTSMVIRAVNGSVNNFGVVSTDSSPMIRQSVIVGSTSSVGQSGSGSTLIANSQLIGPVSGSPTCFDNYDETLTPVTC